MTTTLSKSALKQQQDQLGLFRKFLPSLDLKRQQLLAALKQARNFQDELDEESRRLDAELETLYPLLGSASLATRDLSQLIRVRSVRVATENLAGVRLPVLRDVEFEISAYSTLATPHWIDRLVDALQAASKLRIRRLLHLRRLERLEAASRKVTQRVNLFEKVLIPQARQNIKRIQVFLADQERSAVVRSKIAKSK